MIWQPKTVRHYIDNDKPQPRKLTFEIEVELPLLDDQEIRHVDLQWNVTAHKVNKGRSGGVMARKMERIDLESKWVHIKGEG